MTDQNIARAAQFAPLIERVHGAHHPELTRVREITMQLQQAGNATRTSALFNELRTVTRNYAIPDDVCGAFEATYQALESADRMQAVA
ncbi:MAG TPA: hypothetical protein PJ998_05685 [Terrimesophilobacter sp.]|nr:hypothetical protein [Terrimesophilobacter sp.]